MAWQLPATLSPAGLAPGSLQIMWTINVQRTDTGIRLRVLRWPQHGRYPAQIVWVELEYLDGESELAMLSRASQGAAAALEERRWQE